MRIWGKIFGALGGFLIAGPFGSVMGALLGHAVDEKALSGAGGAFKRPAWTMGQAKVAALFGRRDQVFTVSVVALAAKLCKCDGPVQRSEIDAFKRNFHISPEATRGIGRLFDRARDSRETPEELAGALGAAFSANRALLEEVMVALYSVAQADGPVNDKERAFLRRVQHALGLERVTWRTHETPRHEPPPGRAHPGRPPPPRAPRGPSPYEELGVEPGASDDEVRHAWLALIRANHPDSLRGQNVPEGFIRRATDKVARINAAWDDIKRQRGL